MIKHAVKILIVLAFVVTISSCTRNDCKNVTCPLISNSLPGSPFPEQCISGKCVCENGYEGVLCDTLSSKKYTHNYTVTESCYNTSTGVDLGAFPYYSVYITPNNSSINGTTYPNALLIEGLFGLGINANAFIYTDASNEGNTIVVPAQSENGVNFQGSGTYNPNNGYITINFNYTYQGNSYECDHVFRP